VHQVGNKYIVSTLKLSTVRLLWMPLMKIGVLLYKSMTIN